MRETTASRHRGNPASALAAQGQMTVKTLSWKRILQPQAPFESPSPEAQIAETTHCFCALSKFLTHRACGHDKEVVSCHQVLG